MATARTFTSRPVMGSLTRTVAIKRTMSDTELSEHLHSIYPSSMFAVHDVMPRTLSAPELEHQENMRRLYTRLTPIEQEKLEARLSRISKPLRGAYKVYTFKPRTPLLKQKNKTPAQV